MIFETIEAEGLAHYSYLIGDEAAGVGAVIDPRRDVEIYLELARQHKVRITHILETHIHADFVSGSRELATRTGAPIYLSAAGEYEFNHEPVEDGQTLKLGDFQLKVLHTPGHTPEHICYLISGGLGAEKPWGLFSGDTLFAGEVGRPDLLGDGTEEGLARQLYQTLFDTLLPLGDEVIIYPAHGEGSACGGNIGDRRTSTIGYERRYNPRLQVQNEDQFVEDLLDSLSPAPTYYARLKLLNGRGPRAIGSLPYADPLGPEQFQQEMEKPDTVVIDTREIEAFGGAHIQNSINIPLRSYFPVWAGWILQPEQRLLLVMADDEYLDTIQRHLLRIDCKNVMGYLRQGIRGWIEAGQPFERAPQLSVHELRDRALDESDDLQVLDVRSPEEWEQGFIPTAQHQYLPYLQDYLEELDPLKPVATYCGSGYRSSIAASLLMRNGFDRVYNVPGSIDAWLSAGYLLADVG